jgi:hypothetical protein
VTFEERPEAGKSEWSAYVEIKPTLGFWSKTNFNRRYYILV